MTAENTPSAGQGRVEAVLTWTATKQVNRNDYHGSKPSIVEYRALGTPYKVAQNYQIGGSWSAYRGSHNLADIVSLEQAQAAANDDARKIAAALSAAPDPAPVEAGGPFDRERFLQDDSKLPCRVVPTPHPAPLTPSGASVEAVADREFAERVLAAAVEGAKVAEVCAVLATKYDGKGNAEAANWMPPVSHRIAAAYERHLKRIADAIASLTPAQTQGEPVAWMDDGSTRAGTGTEFRVVTAQTKAGMPKAAAEAYTTPLYATPSPSPASAPSPAGEFETDERKTRLAKMVVNAKLSNLSPAGGGVAVKAAIHAAYNANLDENSGVHAFDDMATWEVRDVYLAAVDDAFSALATLSSPATPEPALASHETGIGEKQSALRSPGETQAEPALAGVEEHHGPFGYLVIALGLDEEHWRLSFEPEKDAEYVSIPMFTKVDPFLAAIDSGQMEVDS